MYQVSSGQNSALNLFLTSHLYLGTETVATAHHNNLKRVM